MAREPQHSKPTRKPKKDETLEVRLPHETKLAFMERCKAEGRTASEAVRGFIEAHLARPLTEPSDKEPLMKLSRAIPLTAAASAGVLALMLFTASPSRAGPDLKALFKVMDMNGDGAVTAEEFTSHPARAKQIAFAAEPPPGAERAPPPGAAREAFMIPLGAPPPGAEGAPPPLPPGLRQLDDETRRKQEREMFTDIDANRDGKVSFVEFESHHRAMIKRGFSALDKNKDGAITAEEFDRAPLFGAGVRVEPGQPLPHPPAPPELFSRLDKNHDGKISEQEFLDQG